MHGPTPVDPAERFMRHVEVIDGHWVWTGALNEHGYGRFYRGPQNPRMMPAHLFAKVMTSGYPAAGLEPDHLCKVRRCVNPDHIEYVTHRENLLRGDTTTARNAARTECPRGHPYSGDNVKFRPNGGRYCATCNRVNALRIYHRKRGRRP